MKTPLNTPASSGRLESLDILRGLDLFLLVFFQPVFMALASRLDLPLLAPVVEQFTHVHWEGFAMWDLVMPLFMFMAGVSMPFSLSKYMDGRADKKVALARVAKRVVLLWLLGAVVQGNLLALDADRIYLYSNTLQAIASGYLITALFYLFSGVRGVVLGMCLLFFIYWLPMTLVGDFSPEGNFAETVDRLLLGRFRDGARLGEDGVWSFAAHYHYTWIWSSLNFAVTVMLGFLTGYTMRRFAGDHKAILKRLLLFGIALLGGGLLLSLQMPIIKTIWSSSMTLFSGGLCVLLLAVFYYFVDYKGWKSGLLWLKIYGMNSIAAYVLGEVVNFRCVAHSLTHGLQQFIGDYYGAWLTFANFLILFFILRLMYKSNLFLKV